jgi:hypothetical protein
MAIHHATIKSAEKMGVILTEEGNGRYSAHWPKNNKRLNGESPKYLLDDMRAIIEMTDSYSSFKYTIEEDSTVSIQVRGTTISVTGLRAAAAFNQAKKLWQESRSELDEDDEEADAETEAEVDEEIAEEEPESSGSVVAARYRVIYKETGRSGIGCGDWLDTLLTEICSTTSVVVMGEDGKVDKDATSTNRLAPFEAICAANGVSTEKYDRTRNGWQGRIRMSGRNMLARVIYYSGVLKMPDTIDGGREYPVPQDWKDAAKAKYKYKDKATPAPVAAAA